jgi:diaminohydroxyphosphoribosylaminopyrimidine deaminase/5-amino-6-(5-phosphoribosylamino)uracil reductase
MHHALRLATRGLGLTAPNPTVGAVAVKDGQLLGAGVTGRGGRPHAEPQALAQAGQSAPGATLYVTLEPCRHHGQTPPCTDAILASGVETVIIACEDPDPRMSGKGTALLREAGRSVITGICQREAEALNAGFFTRVRENRPFITLKCATSLDGNIATASYHSRWITGPLARQRGHLLRATHDAILTGIETALADNPALTCRLPGRAGDSPIRIVADSHLRLPIESQLVQTAQTTPLWIATLPESLETEQEKVQALQAVGVEVLAVEATGESPRRISLSALLTQLAERGITRLLTEGGSMLNAALLKTGKVDEVQWFRAPVLIGKDGIAAFSLFSPEEVTHAPRWQMIHRQSLGDDVLEIYRPLSPTINA